MEGSFVEGRVVLGSGRFVLTRRTLYWLRGNLLIKEISREIIAVGPTKVAGQQVSFTTLEAAAAQTARRGIAPTTGGVRAFVIVPKELPELKTRHGLALANLLPTDILPTGANSSNRESVN